MVYNPSARATLFGANATQQAQHQQLGYFTANGAVDTSSSPAANNVNLLVNTCLLNYMALHNEVGNFSTLFPNHGLGSDLDAMRAFQPIVNGTISNPI